MIQDDTAPEERWLALDFHVLYSATANTLHTCMQSENLGWIWENTTSIGPLLVLSNPGKHTLSFFSPETHFSAMWSAICASQPGMQKKSAVICLNSEQIKGKCCPFQ